MITPQDNEIEAAAMVQMRMGREFNALMVMVATNADVDRKTAIARGASENREENCGRAQVWLELQDFLAGAADRWEQIEKRRKDKQQQDGESAADTFTDPYEECFN
jgi:hypothetical protein